MLEKLLSELCKCGCFPSIYYRGGGVWRAHVNIAGAYWEDSRTPLKALQKAVEAWDRDGRPVESSVSL